MNNIIKILKIEISPFAYVQGYDESDKMVTLFFARYTPFICDVEKVREDIALDVLYEYPHKEKVDIGEVISLLAKVRGIQRKKLDSAAKDLIQKYVLAENWNLSIKVAVLTNTLLVPGKLEPIRAVHPSRMKLFLDDLDLLPDSKIKVNLTMRDLRSAYKYPLLQLTRKVTKNELISWVEKNWEEFVALMGEVPEKDDIRIKDNALTWGQLSDLLLREDRELSYKGACDILQEHFGGNLSINVPDETTLRVYHKRYLKSFKNHIPRQ